MPRIFVEGPDSVGKTHFCEILRRNNPQYALVRPQDYKTESNTWGEVWNIIRSEKATYRPTQKIIFDRSPYSLLVYGPQQIEYRTDLILANTHWAQIINFMQPGDIVYIILGTYEKYQALAAKKNHKDSRDNMSLDEFTAIQDAYKKLQYSDGTAHTTLIYVE